MPMPKKPKSIAKLKKDLDKVFNAYIRKRDSEDGYFTCISSGKRLPITQMNAGHFYPATYLATRWDERNVNGQSSGDNCFKHGNIHGYRKGMIQKYGQEVVDELEALHNTPMKLDRFWLEWKIEHYKQKLCN